MIELRPFNDNDFNELAAEITDARFLLQWAGPKYSYPLDFAQLKDTLTIIREGRPLNRVFKAVRPEISKTVGHIQLMNIDYKTASCVLGRILIFKNFRGSGFGKSMVKMAVQFAFQNLNLTQITLSVFDFNKPAIDTYKKIGFSEFQFSKGARRFRNEFWNVIMMKLCKKNC